MNKAIIKFTQYFVYWACRFILNIFYGYTINNPEVLNHGSRPIVVANHISKWDAFFVIACMPFSRVRRDMLPIKFITANIYYFTPFILFAHLFGCFPAKKNRIVTYGTAAAVKHLKKGYSFVIFPEGHVVKGERVPGKHGIIKIISEHPSPLLLCRISRGKKFRLFRSYFFDYSLIENTQPYDNPDKILDEIYSLKESS